MHLRDSFEAGQSLVYGDVLVQPVVEDAPVAYRVVSSKPPTADDFRSHHASGRQPDLTRPYNAFEWVGVSMFLDLDRVHRLVRHAHQRHKPAFVAAVILRPQRGFHVVYKPRTTHLEVFGLPKDLLEMVEDVA